MGDILMTSPAFRALKRKPGRKLTLLTSRSGAAIAPLIPEIDEAIDFDAPWMKATERRIYATADMEIIQELREKNFDAAIIFTVFSQNPLAAAYLCYLAEIPLRLGYCRENPYQLLNYWLKDNESTTAMRHEVERQLELVNFIGCKTSDDSLSLSVPEIATQTVRSLLENTPGFDINKPWVLIHPGATAESRRYPASQYGVVADTLARNFDLQVVFTGVDSERRLIESIRTNVIAPTTSLVGRINLAEMAALIKLAPVIITNNTGPAHMAAALGTPLVELYALTNPQHTPWKGKSRVLYCDVPCKNCFKSVCPMEHHDCLRLVSPLAVVAAVIDFLNEKGENYFRK
jgi:lipopolysaccharide heptosyltransferase II